MKKRTLLFLVAIMIGFTVVVSAQKPFAGTIKLSIKVEGTDDPNLLSQIPGESEVTIFGNKTKTVMNVQEGFGITSIVDGDTKTSYTIMEIMGMGKYYIEMLAAQLEEKLKNVKFEISYPEEYMEIAGYKCQKAIINITDLETDETDTLVVYVSKDLNPGSSINFNQYPGLEGYPLRVETKIDHEGNEVTMITQATEIIPNKKIKAVDFMLPADAQNVKENPELMKMLGLGDAAAEEEK